MTISESLRIYEAHNEAKQYCIGFERKGEWFFFFADTLKEEWIAREKVSAKNAGKGNKEGYALRLRLKKSHQLEILEKCEHYKVETDFLSLDKNRGRAFERYIRERYTNEKHTNDNTGFWKDGDATINGVKVQIKLNTAQIMTEYTAERMGWA